MIKNHCYFPWKKPSVSRLLSSTEVEEPYALSAFNAHEQCLYSTLIQSEQDATPSIRWD